METARPGEAVSTRGPNDLAQIADNQLNRKNPVEILYNSDLLSQEVKNPGTVAASHSSVLVGRKYDPQSGECRDLLRNSWGGCELTNYNSDYQCDDGNLWVPGSVLFSSVVETTYIQ